jgi:small subunit ribosomal protein S8e
MAIFKARRQGKKPSGGKYKVYRKKRRSELGSLPTEPKIGPTQKKKKRVRGGKGYTTIIRTDVANLLIDGKYKKSKIKFVRENPANRHYVRMNVLTKGAIIETEDGFARITNRPARDGFVNAVLIKK